MDVECWVSREGEEIVGDGAATGHPRCEVAELLNEIVKVDGERRVLEHVRIEIVRATPPPHLERGAQGNRLFEQIRQAVVQEAKAERESESDRASHGQQEGS